MSLQTIHPNTHSFNSKVTNVQVASTDWKQTYPEYFEVEGKLLINETGLNTYGPRQIEIIAYYGLDDNSKSEENGVVYLIETFDGSKGILIYRYDVFTDCKVYDFLKEYADYKYRLYKSNPEIYASKIPRYR